MLIAISFSGLLFYNCWFFWVLKQLFCCFLCCRCHHRGSGWRLHNVGNVCGLLRIVDILYINSLTWNHHRVCLIHRRSSLSHLNSILLRLKFSLLALKCLSFKNHLPLSLKFSLLLFKICLFFCHLFSTK